MKTKRIISLIAGFALLLSGCGSPAPKPQAEPAPRPPKEAGRYLTDFCADEELNAWFDSLEENIPVRLTYIIYGEAPIDMTFTDPALILETAEALKTVKIGGESDIDPDVVDDAGGDGYYFEMEDGGAMSFSFMMGCFKWKDGAYHDVASWGDLREVSARLEKIGNPQDDYIYSDDSGFYTKALESYPTEWRDEAELFGGLIIHMGEETPLIAIARCPDGETDAENYLDGTFMEQMKADAETNGAVCTVDPEVREFTAGGSTLPARLYRCEAEDSSAREIMAAVLETQDSLLREDHLVRFLAVYDADAPDEKDEVMGEFDKAVREFHLKHTLYEEHEVQPGELLLDFCNDDGLRDWFASAERDLPDEITYVEDTWYVITDPDKIRQILTALKTVRIGDVSSVRNGAADRQIFDFYYEEGGEAPSLMFFGPTFDWDGKAYDVLDWGELKNLKIKKMASQSAKS